MTSATPFLPSARLILRVTCGTQWGVSMSGCSLMGRESGGRRFDFRYVSNVSFARASRCSAGVGSCGVALDGSATGAWAGAAATGRFVLCVGTTRAAGCCGSGSGTVFPDRESQSTTSTNATVVAIASVRPRLPSGRVTARR
jgi:hypothetical protein